MMYIGCVNEMSVHVPVSIPTATGSTLWYFFDCHFHLK